jgi:aryl-alcohol dehydrogenase-like predicted oxidoreductase
MADLAKRELGRAGLQVTTLGYGAMELRGDWLNAPPVTTLENAS